MTDLNALRKVFSRSQTGVLQQALLTAGPSDILHMHKLWEAPDMQHLGTWQARSDGPGWFNPNTTFLDMDLHRNDGTAFQYDPEQGSIVYGLPGVYLNTVQVHFVIEDQATATQDYGTAHLRIEDWNVTLNADVPDAWNLDWRSFTWMAFNQAGDQNSTPYITSIAGPQKMGIAYAEYTSVRLLA